MERDLTVGFGMPTIGLDKLSLCINADTLSECRSVKIVCNGVEHTYDPAKLKDALIWILAPYEIHENPSYECMRVAREESLAELLEMRRWDVAQMLKEVEFGEGSHENLSAIANVIYEPCFGWTKDACEYLRDQLVYLIGGERDAQRGCSGDAGDCNHSHEQTPFVGYDVLNNERHKAVCELQKMDGCSLLAHNFRDALAAAISVPRDGASYDDKELCHLICDRLIHLLGGDQIVRNAENYNLEDEPEVQNNKNGDFCKLDNVTITDELRKWAKSCTVRDMVLTTYPEQHAVHGTLEQLIAIADRIDAQFARICEQQEQVLQDTKIVMQDEIDRIKIVMQNEVDRQKDLRDENAKVAEDAIHSSCMYFDLLRDAARDYKRLHDDYVKLIRDHMELYDFAKSIEEEAGEHRWMTLFGVDYAPVTTDDETTKDMGLINLYYKKLKQWMGEAKNLRDTLAARVEGRDRVRQELEECRKALNKAIDERAKANAECRMYREMLNSAAKEYKALQESLGLALGLWWMSATGGFK